MKSLPAGGGEPQGCSLVSAEGEMLRKNELVPNKMQVPQQQERCSFPTANPTLLTLESQQFPYLLILLVWTGSMQFLYN